MALLPSSTQQLLFGCYVLSASCTFAEAGEEEEARSPGCTGQAGSYASLWCEDTNAVSRPSIAWTSQLRNVVTPQDVYRLSELHRGSLAIAGGRHQVRAERAACPQAQATLAVRAGALHMNPAHQDSLIQQRLIIGTRGGCGRKKKDGVSTMIS